MHKVTARSETPIVIQEMSGLFMVAMITACRAIRNTHGGGAG